jgi:hypothetical protein
MSLATEVAIQSSFFVKITNPASTLLFSDHFTAQTIDGSTYTPLGKLMSITPTSSEIRTSFQSVTIAVSGIPDSSLQQILSTKYKGSEVEIRRGIYDVSTGLLLSLAVNPVVKFKGFVNNWSLNEDYDIVNRTSTNVIQFDCTSLIELLSNKRAGRKTNPASMKRFFPTDTSFDRVPNLVNTKFNFGGER